jgi:uncharacterized membrane protein
MRTLFTLVLTLFFVYTSAQTVKGILKDPEDPVYPATITVKETSETVTTEIDGDFTLTLKPGKYNLEIKAEHFARKNIIVNVSSEDVNLGTIKLLNEKEIDEVTLEYYSTGESKAIEMRRNSNAIMDVLSADAMGKLPDVSAAEAV